MSDRRNGRWLWVGITGTVVAIALGIVTILGIPSCSDLVTQNDVDKEIQIVKDAHDRDRDAAAELNAAEHAQFREAFDRQQKATEDNQNEIRWMFKRILGEVEK